MGLAGSGRCGDKYQELDRIGEVATRATEQLHKLAEQAEYIEAAATKEGTLPMVEAAIEILTKHRHIAHRLELISHRRTPNITCRAFKPACDHEGDGGQLSPDIYVTYKGIMPYCGPTYGLLDMHSRTEKMHESKDDKGDGTPRQKRQAHKRKTAGQDADPTAPDEMGDGLFKAGTRYKNAIFFCPSDTAFDIKEGHTQSSVLDKLTEAIRKLRKCNRK